MTSKKRIDTHIQQQPNGNYYVSIVCKVNNKATQIYGSVCKTLEEAYERREIGLKVRERYYASLKENIETRRG